MNQFLPFIGTRYNSQKVKLKDVVSPPYDVISQAMQTELYQRDEHNVVRLELNHDPDPYTSAKTYFDEWKAEEVLQSESAPVFYVYYQTFLTPEGKQVTRRGVLGKLRLTPYSSGDVLPHERTHMGPKEDRVKLLTIAGTQFSPIFGLIDDEQQIFDHTIDSVVASAPLADIDEELASGDEVRHTMWKLDDHALIARLQKLIASKKVIIADGHHRYESSLIYADQHPENEGAQYIMIYLANLHGDGTIILPTHRLLYGREDFNQFDFLSRLRKEFDVEVTGSREEGMQAMNTGHAITLIQFPEAPEFVVVREHPQESDTLSPVEKLAVEKLQERILKPIVGLSQEEINSRINLLYPHTLPELDEMIREHGLDAAFILNPTTPQEVIDVTAVGEFMPQKSTYFYPKLLSGLVFYEFGNNAVSKPASN
jgi:uncharacterized protein (DUF1015 family)